MNEQWKPIPGFEGVYEVSSLGTVRSLDRQVWSARGFWMRVRGRILALSSLPTGHLHVTLKHGGRSENRQVHRLVLEAFAGPCPEGMEACHGDGDPTNNALSNLRWDSRSANVRDAVLHGAHSNTRKTVCANGHPFSPENTRRYGTHRVCRACAREHTRQWRLRRAAGRAA
jgi:hypothetical protein